MFQSIDEIQNAFATHHYIADKALATTIYLAHHLKKPIFLEGEPGVGKTEVAKVMADVTGGKLIRLQCYEGLDANNALYEWNYTKQILQLRIDEARGIDKELIGADLFSEAFLLKRPLLEAIQSDGNAPPVLLIDEVDRSDSEFEAFLLEILSDFQITIPEIGTIHAKHIPAVVLTSNRTREVHEALKRRCLYQWIDYPSAEKELSIVKTKLPHINDVLAQQLCNMMQLFREGDYYKKPGVAETLDWGLALIALGKDALDPEVVNETLGCIFKYQDDIQRAQEANLGELVNQAKTNEKSGMADWMHQRG
ncbi:MoxR family ATPase [Candidatus Poribacteria bacterium]|nr:MoxR family ATPase [Candidatus Poribacteria bacterium]